MRGEFENIWQEAFEGASITPSDQVWHGIAQHLDNNRGRRGWVTILLIAATVTMAFAFPLTIGNSEYEFKPQTVQVADNNTLQKSSPALLSESADLDQAAREVVSEPSRHDAAETPVQSKTRPAFMISDRGTGDRTQNRADLFQATPQGILTYQEFQTKPGSGLNEYYILPVFKVAEDEFNRSLLAFGNINSGRQSALNGFNTMEFLNAAADFESGNDLSNRNYADRSEEGGATFYVGLGAELPVGKRINLNAGLGYQNQRLNGSSNTVLEQNGKQYPIGIYDPIVPGTVFLSENYDYVSNNQFISVPVGVKYAIVNKRVKLRVGLGVSPDFMLSHKVSAPEYGSRSISLSETAYNTVHFTGLFNLDVLLPVHTNYGLALETGLRQGLVPYVQNGNEYATSFNFGVILFYQLRK